MIARRAVAVAGAWVASGVPGAFAQAARQPRIAILSNSVPQVDMIGAHPASATVRALVHGLRDLGRVDGRDVAVDVRSAEGRPERIPSMVEAVVAAKPDVMVVFGPVLLRAAQQASHSIPIVSVGGGLALSTANMARPGGKVTGLVTDAGFSLLNGKRLELLKEAVPNARNVVVIRPPAPADQPLWGHETEQAARTLGMTLSMAAAAGPDDFDAAFAAIARERPHAMLCVDTPANVGNFRRIVDLAAREQLPTVYGQRIFVDAGGWMCYGADVVDLSRRAAAYVDKILRGTRPGDLPIEQPTRFELAIHLGAARALALTIPRTLLLRAELLVS